MSSTVPGIPKNPRSSAFRGPGRLVLSELASGITPLKFLSGSHVGIATGHPNILEAFRCRCVERLPSSFFTTIRLVNFTPPLRLEPLLISISLCICPGLLIPSSLTLTLPALSNSLCLLRFDQSRLGRTFQLPEFITCAQLEDKPNQG